MVMQPTYSMRHPSTPPTAPTATLTQGLLLGLALLQALVDPEDDQTDSNNEDNAKDDDDTLLLLGPVLTLGQLARQKVAGDEGVDGSHCVKERSGDD
jgi:hypothetical protein